MSACNKLNGAHRNGEDFPYAVILKIYYLPQYPEINQTPDRLRIVMFLRIVHVTYDDTRDLNGFISRTNSASVLYKLTQYQVSVQGLEYYRHGATMQSATQRVRAP